MAASKPDTCSPLNTILVIDDDDNWCFITESLLNKVKACRNILTANNGLKGIQKLQELAAQKDKMPALIFLDIKMPVMDGFEFLGALAETPELDLSHTKIYICSSSLHPQDREKAALFGVDGFITKPLTEERLKEILQ